MASKPKRQRKRRRFKRLGKHLRRTREAAGFTKMYVVRNSRITFSHLQKIERGLIELKFRTLRELARVYQVTLSQLFKGYES